MVLADETADADDPLRVTLSDNSKRVSDFALRRQEECSQSSGRRHSVYTAKESKMLASLMAMFFGGPETDGYEWG